MGTIRVLLVEDNPDNFELVKFLLVRAGYDVLAADTGLACLAKARLEMPDLILMDLSLPEMDGWTAARELKADPKTAGIPLIALTAHTLPGDRMHALESGFDEYLSKPLNVEGFPLALANVLDRKKTAQST